MIRNTIGHRYICCLVLFLTAVVTTRPATACLMITVTADPSSVCIGGATSTITAHVLVSPNTDPRNWAPPSPGHQIAFSVSGLSSPGSVSPTSAGTDSNGDAVTVYTSGSDYGTVTITATDRSWPAPNTATCTVTVVSLNDITGPDVVCANTSAVFNITTNEAGHESMVTWGGGGTPSAGGSASFSTQWSYPGNRIVTAQCCATCSGSKKEKAVKVIGGGIFPDACSGGLAGMYLCLANPASSSPLAQFHVYRPQPTPSGNTYAWDISAGSNNAHVVGPANLDFVKLQADAEGAFTLRLTITNGQTQCVETLDTLVHKPSPPPHSSRDCGVDHGTFCSTSPPYYEVHRDVLYTIKDDQDRPVCSALMAENWQTGNCAAEVNNLTDCNGQRVDYFSWFGNISCDGTTTAVCTDVQTIQVAGWTGFWPSSTVQWQLVPHISHSGCGD